MIAKPIFSAPRSALEKKPPHGQPCNNCGLCCMATLCDLGRAIFPHAPRVSKCPALYRTSRDTYACGVVMHPAVFAPPEVRDAEGMTTDKLRAAALIVVRAGQGCDARFNGEPRNTIFDIALDRLDAANADKIKAARELWRVKNVSDAKVEDY